MSRLYHFLISEGILDRLELKSQFIESGSFSGRYAISIRLNKLDWDPKPFKFFTTWLDHPNFLPLIEEVWTNSNVNGIKLFILKGKLKILKSKLKSWNFGVFDKHGFQINRAINGMNQLDYIIVNDVDI